MSSFNNVMSVLISKSDSCGSNVAITVGNKVSPTGKASPLLARFKLPVPCTSFKEILVALRKLGTIQVIVTMPRVQVTDIVSVSLRPVYSAKVLADVLEGEHKPAESNDVPAKSNGIAARV